MATIYLNRSAGKDYRSIRFFRNGKRRKTISFSIEVDHSRVYPMICELIESESKVPSVATMEWVNSGADGLTAKLIAVGLLTIDGRPNRTRLTQAMLPPINGESLVQVRDWLTR